MQIKLSNDLFPLVHVALGVNLGGATPINTAPAKPAEQDAWTITLQSGKRRDIGPLTFAELVALQWYEERAFATAIKSAPRGSAARAEAFAKGYDAITTILTRRIQVAKGGLAMGFDPRYIPMVVGLLRRQRIEGRCPRFFEVGFGSGLMLNAVRNIGAEVAGIEVSAAMREQAVARLPQGSAARLYLGDFLTHPLDGQDGSYDLIYWNDVFEHIPTDEIQDFVRRIFKMLRPGGELVTITPSWHMRPSDITGAFRPPRSEPEGFHLKEYTLRETTAMLRAIGFDRIATPFVLAPGRAIVCGNGLAGLKRLLEPAIEWTPFRLAQMLCRSLALGCTIARKPR